MSQDSEGQDQLLAALEQMASMVRLYGKTLEHIADLGRGFIYFLGDYPAHVIIEALKKHIRQSNQIATPADIIAIIKPKPPELSPAVYYAIKQKIKDGNQFVSDREYFFVKSFEEYNIEAACNFERDNYKIKRIAQEGWDHDQITEFLKD